MRRLLLFTLVTSCGTPNPMVDAGAPSDAGASDAGSFDAGTFEAGVVDAGSIDAGATTLERSMPVPSTRE